MKHQNKCVNGSLKAFPKGKKGCSAFMIVGVVMMVRSKTSNSHKRTLWSRVCCLMYYRNRLWSQMVDEWVGRSLFEALCERV